MGSEEQVYITLPSNSSMNYFPDNTLASFKTKLLSPLELHDQWEVGLAEIIYPYTWFNINFTNNQFKFLLNDEVIIVLRIPEGYYKDIEIVCRALVDILPLRLHNNINIFQDSTSKRVHIELDQVSGLYLSEGLGQVFGYPEGLVTGQQKSPFPPDLEGGINTLYVYTDIVDEQRVGDVTAPLLRIVSVPRRRAGEFVTFTYGTPHYVPVKSKYVDTIQVDIRSDFGEKIPFQRGRVVIKLHFRSCNKLY